MIKLPKFLSRTRLLAVICISLLIHLLVGVFYGSYVIFEKYNPPEPELVAPPIPQGIEPRKKEYKIKMEKSQKQSSAPLPIPIVANVQADLSLDNIDMNVSSPRSEQNVRGVGSGEGRGKGFGNGFGNGTGFDIDVDVDVEFFGAKGGGQHIAFVIDYSQSMQKDGKETILRRESKRIFDELPKEVQFAVVFFAGPAWDPQKDPSKDTDNWVREDSFNSYRPKKLSKLPKLSYQKASGSARSRFARIAEDTGLVSGTIYDVPIYMALTLDPIPDTIFFMTDGACPQKRGIDQIKKMVEQLKAAGKSVPVIHTVGLGINDSKHLDSIAQLTGGTSSFLTTKQYEKMHGKKKIPLVDKNKAIKEEIEIVDPDEYPINLDINAASR